ncbi:MAG: hypothetical protein ACYC63_13030 [Armatimonadota bacterium]
MQADGWSALWAGVSALGTIGTWWIAWSALRKQTAAATEQDRLVKEQLKTAKDHADAAKKSADAADDHAKVARDAVEALSRQADAGERSAAAAEGQHTVAAWADIEAAITPHEEVLDALVVFAAASSPVTSIHLKGDVDNQASYHRIQALVDALATAANRTRSSQGLRHQMVSAYGERLSTTRSLLLQVISNANNSERYDALQELLNNSQ